MAGQRIAYVRVSSFERNPAREDSGRYDRCNRLSVLYFPFSEVTPYRVKVLEVDLRLKAHHLRSRWMLMSKGKGINSAL